MLQASCNHQNVPRDERWDLTGFEEDEMNGSLHRAISMVVVAALLVTTTACHDTTSLTITAPQLPAPKTDRIVGVTTVDGQIVTFDDPALLLDPKTKTLATPAVLADPKNEVVVAGEVDDKKVQIPLSRVQRFHIDQEKGNTWKTVGLVAGIVAPIVIIGASVANSGSKKDTSTSTGTASGAAAPSSTPGTERGTSSTPSRTPGPSRAAWRGAATWSWTGSGRRTIRTGS